MLALLQICSYHRSWGSAASPTAVIQLHCPYDRNHQRFRGGSRDEASSSSCSNEEVLRSEPPPLGRGRHGRGRGRGRGRSLRPPHVVSRRPALDTAVLGGLTGMPAGRIRCEQSCIRHPTRCSPQCFLGEARSCFVDGPVAFVVPKRHQLLSGADVQVTDLLVSTREALRPYASARAAGRYAHPRIRRWP